MITQETANKIAHEWISAWNSHDIDEIMKHYDESIEFSSPFIVKLLGQVDGKVIGKEKLRKYFIIGLEAYPDLNFVLHSVLTGTNSITLVYTTVKSMLSAEVMEIGRNSLVTKVAAHTTEVRLKNVS